MTPNGMTHFRSPGSQAFLRSALDMCGTKAMPSKFLAAPFPATEALVTMGKSTKWKPSCLNHQALGVLFVDVSTTAFLPHHDFPRANQHDGVESTRCFPLFLLVFIHLPRCNLVPSKDGLQDINVYQPNHLENETLQ